MAYHRHRASEDPFVRVGAQDLTAHVNFSALEDASAREGLQTLGLTTQHRFLIALGLADRIAELSSSSAPADVRRRLAMMSLIHPEGMGGIFRVLVQGKGVASVSLRGLADPFAPAGASPWAGRRGLP
jgi:SAM-dependent MidA family methyltransferase